MNDIQDIIIVLNDIKQIVSNQNFQLEIQKLTQLRSTGQQITQNQNIIPQLETSLNNINQMLKKINLSSTNLDFELIIEKLGFSNLLGEKGNKYFEDLKNQIRNNPNAFHSYIQNTNVELNNLKNKTTQFLNLIQPFEVKSYIKSISNDEGIIEIVFDGGVSIDDFKEAKDQMNDWFLIIEGYARLLGVTREDFEIINISKNSPVNFKIKTSLKNTTLFLSIITSVLLIEKTVLENKLMIEQLKHNNLVPDSEIQKTFIETAEKNIDLKIEAGINSIVSKKLKEFNIDKNNGDIETNFKKGVQNQYNFVVNGGTVSVNVINGEIKKDVETLENAKKDIKQIKEAYENQKSLMSGQENQEKFSENKDLENNTIENDKSE